MEPSDHRQALKALEYIEQTTTRRVKILGLVQEALGQLRLDMRYMIFDLEATRRERDEWKEKYTNPGGEGL